MSTRFRSLASLTALCAAMLAGAQDADHLTTNGAGQSFLAPDALVPGGLITQPFNVTIGTTGGALATLRVRGDQLPVNDFFDPTYRCTFRTDVGSGINQNWSMVRGADEIGRLWHKGRRTIADFFWSWAE